MTMYWVYVLPNWLFGILTVLVVCVNWCGGPLPDHAAGCGAFSMARIGHNDIVGFYMAWGKLFCMR